MKPLYKILIISGIVIIGILIIYFGWKKLTAPPAVITPSTPNATGTLPLGEKKEEPGKGGAGAESNVPPPAESDATASGTIIASDLKKISENEVFDFWVIPSTGEVFYLTPLGQVFSAKEGPDLEISSQSITALNFIEISPDGEKILAAFGNPIEPSWGIFDSRDKTWQPLPSEITNATWGLKDTELFAIIKNKSEVNLANVDLSKTPPAYKVILKDFRFKDIKLAFKSPNTLLILEKPSAFYAGRLWRLDLKTLSLNLLLSPEKGLLFNQLADQSANLKFSSPNNFFILGENLENLVPVIFSTLPSKCSRSRPLYCFAPQNIPTDTTLPDDYFKRRFLSIDSLYSIDIVSADTELLFQSNNNDFPAIDGEHPTYSYRENNIYFKNRFDNGLYRLKVEKIKEQEAPIGD
jgi:hypothetical protein